MMIVCPNCSTSYQVEPSSLGATGRSVRCVRCKKTWFASNPEALTAIALSHRRDVAALTSAAASSFDSVPAPALQRPSGDSADAPGAFPDQITKSLPADPEPAAQELVRDDRGPAPLPAPGDTPAQTDAVLPTEADQVAGPLPPMIDDAPALVPGDGVAAPVAQAEGPEDVESVAARKRRRQAASRRTRRPLPGWSTMVLALIAINAGLVAWRADIVRSMPQTAALYAAVGMPVNLRGLAFSEIVTRTDVQDGVPMLVVEGIIKSIGRRAADVPRLRFAVRNAGGQEIYSWTAVPERNVLAAGATMPFRSRLASSPPEAHAVLVRFFNRRDLVEEIH